MAKRGSYMGVKSTKINIMRKITQEEYDSFEMVNGIKICPSFHCSGMSVRSGMIDVCVEKLNSLKA